MFLQGDSARAPLNCRFSFSSFRAHSWIAPQERFLPHQGYTFFLVSIKRSDNLTSVWDISGPEFHLCPIKPLLQPSNSSPPTLSKPTPFPLSQIMVAYSTTCLRISILAPTSGQNQTLISISFPKTCPKFSTFFWPLHTKVQRLFFNYYSFLFLLFKKYLKQCSCNLALNFQSTFIFSKNDHFIRSKYPLWLKLPHSPTTSSQNTVWLLSRSECYKGKTTKTLLFNLKQNHLPFSQVPHVISRSIIASL